MIIIPIAPRAYAEGYQARMAGQPRQGANGTTNRAGWLQGYDAAQAAREEDEFARPAGPAAPLADLPFTLRAEVATTPSAARLQRPFRFEDQP